VGVTEQIGASRGGGGGRQRSRARSAGGKGWFNTAAGGEGAGVAPRASPPRCSAARCRCRAPTEEQLDAAAALVRAFDLGSGAVLPAGTALKGAAAAGVCGFLLACALCCSARPAFCLAVAGAAPFRLHPCNGLLPSCAPPDDILATTHPGQPAGVGFLTRCPACCCRRPRRRRRAPSAGAHRRPSPAPFVLGVWAQVGEVLGSDVAMYRFYPGLSWPLSNPLRVPLPRCQERLGSMPSCCFLHLPPLRLQAEDGPVPPAAVLTALSSLSHRHLFLCCTCCTAGWWTRPYRCRRKMPWWVSPPVAPPSATPTRPPPRRLPLATPAAADCKGCIRGCRLGPSSQSAAPCVWAAADCCSRYPQNPHSSHS
jgi:hypothetical protein